MITSSFSPFLTWTAFVSQLVLSFWWGLLMMASSWSQCHWGDRGGPAIAWPSCNQTFAFLPTLHWRSCLSAPTPTWRRHCSRRPIVNASSGGSPWRCRTDSQGIYDDEVADCRALVQSRKSSRSSQRSNPLVRWGCDEMESDETAPSCLLYTSSKGGNWAKCSFSPDRRSM